VKFPKFSETKNKETVSVRLRYAHKKGGKIHNKKRWKPHGNSKFYGVYMYFAFFLLKGKAR
jgi:hypothetical protein